MRVLAVLPATYLKNKKIVLFSLISLKVFLPVFKEAKTSMKIG
jgi:hypothetical protein